MLDRNLARAKEGHDDAAPRGVSAAIAWKGEPTPKPEPKPEPGRVEMLRPYNPYTGEHFYTASAALSAGPSASSVGAVRSAVPSVRLKT